MFSARLTNSKAHLVVLQAGLKRLIELGCEHSNKNVSCALWLVTTNGAKTLRIVYIIDFLCRKSQLKLKKDILLNGVVQKKNTRCITQFVSSLQHNTSFTAPLTCKVTYRLMRPRCDITIEMWTIPLQKATIMIKSGTENKGPRYNNYSCHWPFCDSWAQWEGTGE